MSSNANFYPKRCGWILSIQKPKLSLLIYMMLEKYQLLDEILQRRLEQKRFRQLYPFLSNSPSEPTLNFAHQDLFYLLKHDFIKEHSINAIAKWGSGYHHSREISTHLDEHFRLEELISSIIQKDHIFLFNTSQNIHEWILSKLSNPKSYLFIEKELEKQFRLSSFNIKGPVYTFNGNNLESLDEALQEVSRKENVVKIIAIETLSSQTGGFWDEKALSEIVKKHNTVLYVDDSSAFGIYGQRGLGLAKNHKEIDITLYHFQNSLSLPVSAIGVCPFFHNFLHHYLEPSLNLFPLYPSLLGAFQGMLKLLPDMEAERDHILSMSKWLRNELIKKGWNIGSSNSHIIPLYLPNEQALLSLSKFLAENNVIALYPKINKNKSESPSIRFTLHSKHSFSAVKKLAELLTTWKKSIFDI
jgi:8-amino-7-oxononanoate synthase